MNISNSITTDYINLGNEAQHCELLKREELVELD